MKTAWLFDVDGVITKSTDRESTDPRVLREIIKKLKMDQPVALITGRSQKWLLENVIEPLEREATKLSFSLDNLFVAGEVGGVTTTYKNGKRSTQTDETLSLPKNIIQKADAIVKEKFSNAVFLDTTKKTMTTFQVYEDYNLSKFKEAQKELVPQLEELFKKNNLDNKFTVLADRLSINLRNTNATKINVVRQVLKWLKTKTINPSKFVIFGDSASDLEMAQAIFEAGQDFEFVFVGDEEELENQSLPFPITFTKEKFENGTLEYLSSSTI